MTCIPFSSAKASSAACMPPDSASDVSTPITVTVVPARSNPSMPLSATAAGSGSGTCAFGRAAGWRFRAGGFGTRGGGVFGSRGVRAGAGDARGAQHPNNCQRYEQRPHP